MQTINNIYAAVTGGCSVFNEAVSTTAVAIMRYNPQSVVAFPRTCVV